MIVIIKTKQKMA